MKSFLSVLLLLFLLGSLSAQEARPARIGWFVSPEAGLMFLEGHAGRTVGVSLGLKVLRNHLKVGIFNYARSGPINPATFRVSAYGDIPYQGSSQLTLRADHGAFGLMLAPSFRLGRGEIDLPIQVGMLGAGFYLFGEARNTPDGRRVSAWENELMNAQDADFGNLLEVGLRGMIPLASGVQLGAGLHYTRTQGWAAYYDPSGQFYNNKLRMSLFLNFGSK